MNTSDLQARALAGDATAFGELIRSWDHDLRSVVWTVVRSAAATDEIMQASYEKAFRNIARFDGGASMKTWLHTVCLRGAIDHARTAPQPTPADVGTSAPTSEVSDDDAAELGQAFDSLGRVDQVLLMLTAGLGYSFDETATIVGMERGTVASKVGLARVELRNGRDS